AGGCWWRRAEGEARAENRCSGCRTLVSSDALETRPPEWTTSFQGRQGYDRASGRDAMPRLLASLVLLAAFAAGWRASALFRPVPASDVERLQQQVTTLQARLQAREQVAGARPSGLGSAEPSERVPVRRPSSDAVVTAAISEDRGASDVLGGAAPRARGERQSARA